MKLVVESEISATSYKKLVGRLKNLSKKQLWDVLDHYIFHVMSDADVNELLSILDEKALDEKPVVTASTAFDDDLFFTVDPKERFRPPVLSSIPTKESLDKFKHSLDLLYDEDCFQHYIDPELQKDIATALIAYAEAEGVPVLDHWKEFSVEGE